MILRHSAIAVLLSCLPATAQEAAITLEKVKYAQLGKAVRDLKGKVVVVDFWATT